jgi:NADH-quinone oxidoreductase subunit L
MLVPLLVLSIGAITTGAVFAPYFIGDHAHAFWGASIFNSPEKHMMEALHHAPEWVPMVVSIFCFSGISLAFLLYMVFPNIPARLAAAAPGLYRFLLNKWYFDELYDRIFVQPALRLANFLWKTGDTKYIDGMPNGAASLAAGAARGTVQLQTGRVASYAFAMIIGLVAFITIFLLGR